MNALQILHDKKIRPSGLRLKILDYILNHKTHPTIDEIYDALIEDNPTLSKTTVYNTTKVLFENGVVRQLNMDGQPMRYDGEMKMHGHFCCRECNKVYDVELLTELEAQFKGFVVEDTQLNYVGICENCNTKLN